MDFAGENKAKLPILCFHVFDILAVSYDFSGIISNVVVCAKAHLMEMLENFPDVYLKRVDT